jgi:hypothetical protein
MGRIRNSLRSNNGSLFFPFFVPHNRQRQKRNFKVKSNSNRQPAPINRRQINLHGACIDVVAVVELALQPLGTQPFVCCEKWIRNEGCLSRRRVSFISHFLQHTNGNPKGKSAVAFLLLTISLAKQRKVSSCRATPGRQSPINAISCART